LGPVGAVALYFSVRSPEKDFFSCCSHQRAGSTRTHPNRSVSTLDIPGFHDVVAGAEFRVLGAKTKAWRLESQEARKPRDAEARKLKGQSS